MAAFSDSAPLAAQTRERIARSKAQANRLTAATALTRSDRDHYLAPARLQYNIADTQRCIIETLIKFRASAKTNADERDES